MPTFAWDDDNLEHLRQEHPGVLPADADSIWQLPWVQLPNVRGRAQVPFLGIDRKGRLLALPSDPTGQHDVWRPRTAHEVTTEWQRAAYYDTVEEASETGGAHD